MTTQPEHWPALYHLAVGRVDYDGEGISEISVSSAMDTGRPHEDGFEAVPQPQLFAAAKHSAGVLARVAVAATEATIDDRSVKVSTNLVGADWVPSSADTDGPSYMAIEVPTTRADEWQARLIDWLERCA